MMKRNVQFVELIFGLIILLGGFLTYGLGLNKILPVPRPDLIVIGTTLIGSIILISGACDLLIKKSREMEIEEKDERNIAISNAAMASGFKFMSVAISISIFGLIFMGYLNVVSCFTMIGAFTAGQIAFAVRLWYLNRTM